MTDVKITRCTEPDELYRRYNGQSKPQATYIELDLHQESLLADYDAEVGSGSPAAVRHGFERRYAIPVLTGEAANRVMEEISPLAARVWDIDGATNGHEAEEHGITAETSDERLDEIAAKITQDFAGCGESPVAVVHGLDDYLRGLRADLAEQPA
ncbi:hypothetical protein [Streptomyces rubiginosohelvolus]|uniref:hypothetical protein n=1 Tax=Streptomyces rubiginosohelvolus TaxID=67362 RepID=UPI00381A77E8